jgi:hypothetical protein
VRSNGRRVAISQGGDVDKLDAVLGGGGIETNPEFDCGMVIDCVECGGLSADIVFIDEVVIAQLAL